METAMSWRISNSKPCAPFPTRLPVSVLLVLNIGEGVLVDVDIPQATTLLDCRDFSGAISQHATMKLWILQTIAFLLPKSWDSRAAIAAMGR